MWKFGRNLRHKLSIETLHELSKQFGKEWEWENWWKKSHEFLKKAIANKLCAKAHLISTIIFNSKNHISYSTRRSFVFVSFFSLIFLLFLRHRKRSSSYQLTVSTDPENYQYVFRHLQTLLNKFVKSNMNLLWVLVWWLSSHIQTWTKLNLQEQKETQYQANKPRCFWCERHNWWADLAKPDDYHILPIHTSLQ